MTGNAFVDHHKKLVAFWTPKCACTAVAYWFAEGVIGENDLIKNKCQISRQRKWLRNNGYLYNYEQAYHLISEFNYSSVYFTRHPATRLVSSYLNKFVIYKDKKLTKITLLEGFARKLVRLIAQNNGWDLKKYQGIRFIDLLDYLETNILHSEKLIYVDHHWDTQVKRGIKIQVNPKFIVHQESFDADLTVVNNHFGINLIPPKLNSSIRNDANNKSTENVSSVFSADLAASDLQLDYNNFLDSDILTRIGKIYQIDYDYFKYDPYDLKLIPSKTVLI